MDQEWKKKSDAGPLHPVVNVSYFDAIHFCGLLSRKDMRNYRLPTDHEWSCAVGIGDKEDANASPEDKKRKLDGVYPWGGPFPPGPRDGNYGLLENQFEKTAPVGSFVMNPHGLYDLGGNAAEICLIPTAQRRDRNPAVYRGGSWGYSTLAERASPLLSSERETIDYDARGPVIGFRVVLVPEEGE